jgi:hypothetical protein
MAHIPHHHATIAFPLAEAVHVFHEIVGLLFCRSRAV